MPMEFSFQDTKTLHKIKVFGIGGAGNNAINNMISAGLNGPVFVAANSDLQDLEKSLAPIKIQVGSKLTKGLGCGGKAEVGREAAREDIDRIKEMLADSDMVFITAGMGGGTGSGGAPVVAEELAKLNDPPLIVAVVTKPFPFEGSRRMRQADTCIKELTQHCHSIITVPNEKLLSIVPKGSGFKEAIRMADDVLLKAVQGITDLITQDGYMNVDFQDVKTIMTKRGPTIMGVGQATGEDRAVKAAQQAISSPLLDDLSIKGAKGILINITGPEDLSMDEVNNICSLIQNEAHEDADIISGVAFESTLASDGTVRVTVIATGLGGNFGGEDNDKEEPKIVVKEEPVVNSQPEENKSSRSILDYTVPKGLENSEPAQPNNNQSLASSRRDRLNSRYETYNLDDDILDTPTYLRIKAD